MICVNNYLKLFHLQFQQVKLPKDFKILYHSTAFKFIGKYHEKRANRRLDKI